MLDEADEYAVTVTEGAGCDNVTAGEGLGDCVACDGVTGVVTDRG